MKKAVLKFAAVLGACTLALSGCATPPPASTPDTKTSTQETPKPAESTSSMDHSTMNMGGDFTACMVSDFGGFDDKSFNETAYNGMKRAEKELGIKVTTLESKAEADYAPNVQKMVDSKCGIIVTVGFALAKATEDAAKANPNMKLAIVDYPSFKGVNNAKGLLFDSAQPSFLAGYLAAGMTKTGTVGTFGGAKYPTVTIFMHGFAQGVAYYNKTKGKSVKVLGWDAAKQDGQFIGGNDPFGDIPGGKNTAATLVSQGADIILPVAGPAGLGALQVAKESGGKVSAIWVDADGYVSQPDYKSVIMTSVQKAMDVAVFEAIKGAKEGAFNGEPYLGTLANKGVALAPYYDFDSKIPADLKSEIEQLKADIISGKIKVELPK